MPTQKSQSILQDYAFHTRLIHRFVDGITHAESILQLPFDHNCMNWILGHVVTNRSHVLETVGAAHDWQEEIRALYHTDTPPIKPDDKSVQFETLIRYLDGSVELLKAALENVSDTYLEEIHTNYRGEKTRYAHLTGFHWHEGFHIGQLEILKSFIESKR
jgi:DinB superfamily